VLLFKNDTAAHYTPEGGGRLLFVRNDNLYAQSLDIEKWKLDRDPELIQRGIASEPAVSNALFSVARSGAVAWRPGTAALSQMTVFDRHGKQAGTAGPPTAIHFVSLSPDETRLLGGSETGAWLLEPNRPGRLSFGLSPWFCWSPDGSGLVGAKGTRVLEQSLRGWGGVHELAEVAGLDRFEDISQDGKQILYLAGGSVFSGRLNGSVQERIPKQVIRTGETIFTPRFSPDGRWVVYGAITMQNEGEGIYVQALPDPGLRKKIADHGRYPFWRRDGKEIVYFDQNRIWSVRVDKKGGELSFGGPEQLFSVRAGADLLKGLNPLAVTRDGSRIYFPQDVEGEDSDVIHIGKGLWK
jgi:hypothetical protein